MCGTEKTQDFFRDSETFDFEFKKKYILKKPFLGNGGMVRAQMKLQTFSEQLSVLKG